MKSDRDRSFHASSNEIANSHCAIPSQRTRTESLCFGGGFAAGAVALLDLPEASRADGPTAIPAETSGGCSGVPGSQAPLRPEWGGGWAAEVALPGGIAVRFSASASAEWIGSVVQALQAAMLSLSPATRVFLALAPIDGRKGFNGLYTLVKETLQQEPTSGFLFVFLNKRRNRLKILTYDGSGLWMLTKRLDRGTYAAPVGEGQSLNLRPEDLTLLIHGIESTSRRPWHRV